MQLISRVINFLHNVLLTFNTGSNLAIKLVLKLYKFSQQIAIKIIDSTISKMGNRNLLVKTSCVSAIYSSVSVTQSLISELIADSKLFSRCSAFLHSLLLNSRMSLTFVSNSSRSILSLCSNFALNAFSVSLTLFVSAFVKSRLA